MAGPSASVKVLGYPELARGTRELAENIAERAPDRFEPVASAAAASVRTMVPRRTGQLASSITSGQAEGAAIVGYSGSVPYDGWIEFGGTRGRPYVSTGRYLFPTAGEADTALEAVGNQHAREQIARQRWPKPIL